MVHARYCAAYPKQLYVVYKANMWYLYCITSFVLDPSTLFFVSCDLILTLCSKNRKIRKQNEMKMKMENKIERD